MSSAYLDAGVDVAGAEALVDKISETVTNTWGSNVVGGFGGFAAGVKIPTGYTSPVLMMSTDGVGTKLDIARRANRFETIGFDLVAMCVDDLAAVGAEPISFVDYIAVGSLNVHREAVLVDSIARACSAAGCALVGGETAEHPGVVHADHVDLAGAALGVVEEGQELHSGMVNARDVLIGVASPNLRSNGFSLVRRILDGVDLSSPFEGKTLEDVLLDPSVIYAKAAIAAARIDGVNGLVHVTGGGLPGNVPRVLPPGLGAVLEVSTWTPPGIFSELIARGSLTVDDAFGTFNMGVGYIAVAAPQVVEEVIELFNMYGHQAWVLGSVEQQAAPFTLK
jgi:phosphoribosylformylglycinamidine cyclo-ligase